jgi:hypothetical protein
MRHYEIENFYGGNHELVSLIPHSLLNTGFHWHCSSAHFSPTFLPQFQSYLSFTTLFNPHFKARRCFIAFFFNFALEKAIKKVQENKVGL